MVDKELGMKLKDKLYHAGFDSKADFARYIGMHVNTVPKWGEDLPVWAERILELRMRVLRFEARE